MSPLRPLTPEPSRRDAESKPVVLVVDDDEALRGTIRRFLRSRNMQVEEACDGNAALAVLEQVPIDVVLSDVRMPNMGGEQLLQQVVAKQYACAVVMMTAFADLAPAINCVRSGAYAFITKPFASNEALAIEVRNACTFKRLSQHALALEEQVLAARSGLIVGESPAMRNLLRALSGVAPTSASVLVCGETGTGKELVVRALHQGSTRASQPFVSVNCASLPEQLVESALFGNVRGAFSSSTPARAGLFESAHGGTLFLDEIGELPPVAQARLLSVLETGTLRRVGGDDVREVDVRILATSNADLRAMCSRGEFRSDLFYRLNVATLRVPPLRERGTDAVLLAAHFLREQAARDGRVPPTLAPATADYLCRYSWPGNVRELRNAMHHAMLVCPRDTIVADCLPPDVLREVSQVGAREPTLFDAALMRVPFQQAKRELLGRFTAAYLQAAADLAGGNLSEAARRSGLPVEHFRKLRASAEPEDNVDRGDD